MEIKILSAYLGVLIISLLAVIGCVSGPPVTMNSPYPNDILTPQETDTTQTNAPKIANSEPPITSNASPVNPTTFVDTTANRDNKLVNVTSKVPDLVSSNVTITPSITVSEPSPRAVSGNLSQLHTLKTIKISLTAINKYSNYNSWGDSKSVTTKGTIDSVNNLSITWNGTAFSGSWSTEPGRNPDPTVNIIIAKASIDGMVSEDGNTLLTLNYSYRGKVYAGRIMNDGNCSVYFRKIQLRNVPLNDPLSGIGYFDDIGIQIKDYIVQLECTERSFAGYSESSSLYVSTDWSNTGFKIPRLSVTFSK